MPSSMAAQFGRSVVAGAFDMLDRGRCPHMPGSRDLRVGMELRARGDRQSEAGDKLVGKGPSTPDFDRFPRLQPLEFQLLPRGAISAAFEW